MAMVIAMTTVIIVTVAIVTMAKELMTISVAMTMMKSM